MGSGPPPILSRSRRCSQHRARGERDVQTACWFHFFLSSVNLEWLPSSLLAATIRGLHVARLARPSLSRASDVSFWYFVTEPRADGLLGVGSAESGTHDPGDSSLAGSSTLLLLV